MAKKTNQNNDHKDKNATVREGDGVGSEKKQKAAGVMVVILKIDLHCEGCAGRVVKVVRTLDGVESVRIGDNELNKLTVIGNVDPVKLRQKVEEKTKKKVELISPATKKTNDGGGGDRCGGKDDKNEQTKLDKTKTVVVNKDNKKPQELPVTTAVFQVSLHCQGCVSRIRKLVSKTKGFVEMSFDKNKDLVTVKGAIDMQLLLAALQQKLKRVVEIVPIKKDDGDGGSEKKRKGGGGGEKGKGGGGNDGEGKGDNGGKKKGKGPGGDNDGDGNGGGGGCDSGSGKAEEVYKMESYVDRIGYPIGYPYPHTLYGPRYVDYVHAPQLFSDENPNACLVM
ncbi:heavy metal-associated isoprenylated plant protein 3-like [Rutidosis leptorrhynchoides]|uniref:heavy metal-associated isoprenylated plant protein 3-like n=1 Tax=Rutidosis leptorrhynchoides TaxID=125765 RepID=UPI003A99698C